MSKKDLKLEASQKTFIKPRSVVHYVDVRESIADLIYDTKTHSTLFLLSGENGKREARKKFFTNEKNEFTNSEAKATQHFVSPVQVSGHIAQRFVCVPTGVLEYGTTEELYQKIRAFVKRFVILEDERFYSIAACYVLLSFVYDRFNTLPYLRVIGDLGTGKSRFLEVVGKLCNRAILASGSISMAAVFRTLDVVRGTLVFDEADFRSSDMTDDIVKILNGGHKKDAPVVRMESINDRFVTKAFNVFGPKVLGSRQEFKDTALESRCITQKLFPLKKMEGVPTHLPTSFEEEAQELRNKLLMFRFKNFSALGDDESSLEGLEFPRLRQTSLALTSIAKFIGDDVLVDVIGYLADYEKELLSNVSTDTLADVLLCIAWLIETDSDVRKSGRLYVWQVANEFNSHFYEEYTSRETRELETKDGPLTIQGQRVSARKIGSYISQLGFAKARNADGIHIPVREQLRKINSLVERYSLVEIIKERKALLEKEKGKKQKTVPICYEDDSCKESSSGCATDNFVPDEEEPF